MTDPYKPQQYYRAATATLEEVLPLIFKYVNVFYGGGSQQKRDKAKEYVAGHLVKVTGNRLQTFAVKGCTCSACGLKASFFAVETNQPNGSGYHLNLWGVREDGQEVLFTHDHTIDRADGGPDNLTNTTTMCSPCNHAKSLVTKAARDERRAKEAASWAAGV